MSKQYLLLAPKIIFSLLYNVMHNHAIVFYTRIYPSRDCQEREQCPAYKIQALSKPCNNLPEKLTALS